MPSASRWPEHARLRAESQRIRGEAVRVQIAAVQAFCSVVESEARWESAEKAERSIEKIWPTIACLKRHLSEPEHVPAESAGELLSLLATLEERALRIHQSLYGQASRSAAAKRIGPGS